jgi:hypothetical protein
MTARTPALLCVLGLTLAAVAVAVATGAPEIAGTQPGHSLLHVNCPPGSHGVARTVGAGQRLLQARDEARTARALESRAITAR